MTSYECRYCHNYWSIDEGFRLDTMECASCQRWDDEKHIRDKEQTERVEFRKEHSNGVDFKYVAGDPYW